MFELFPDQPVYEFPAVLNVAYAMLWSVVLSSIIAITHKVTFRNIHYPTNFFQSLILGSVVTALVMMAVGDSLARGLGVFGAMAIIRFRTIITDPRDVLFLFASLSIGLSIGVFGYTIAFVGTIMFCTVALILNYSPFEIRKTKMRLNFVIKKIEDIEIITQIASKHCDQLTLLNVISSTNKEEEPVLKYQYFFVFKKSSEEHALLEDLLNTEQVSGIKISMEDDIK